MLPPPIRVTIVAASLCSAWPTLLSGVGRKARSMMEVRRGRVVQAHKRVLDAVTGMETRRVLAGIAVEASAIVKEPQVIKPACGRRS